MENLIIDCPLNSTRGNNKLYSIPMKFIWLSLSVFGNVIARVNHDRLYFIDLTVYNHIPGMRHIFPCSRRATSALLDAQHFVQ